MDKSIVAVEESHRRSDYLASASKSFGSLVQINSIAIDISCAMEETQSTPHEHFSIRGYVAGIRKSNWKICSPFASEADDDNDDSVDNLPPLSVPNFRWWQCANCVPDIATDKTTLQMLLSDRSDAGPSSCRNVDADKYGLFSHSKRQIGDEHGSKDSRNAEDNYPSNMIVKYNPCCTEGQKATTFSGERIDMRNNVNRNPFAEITQTKSLQILERRNDNADAPEMVCITEDPSIGIDEPENASSGKETHRRKPKLRSLADIMEEEKNLTSEHHRTRSESTEMEADLDPHLQSDVPSDIAKGTKSPLRKRKNGLGVDRVPPLEMMTHPIGTAKRSKGPIPYSEKTFKRAEISDIEPQENASSRLDLGPTANTKQIKPKKSKALDIGKKMKRAHIENRAPHFRDPPLNLHKNVVAAETSFNNNRGQYFQSSIFGQRMDRVSDLSERVGVEGDHSPLMPSRKNIIGDCNVNDKVALDLSLNSCIGDGRNSDNQSSSSLQQHRAIPDLNVSFNEKAYVTQGKQLLNIPENRTFNLHKNLDMSASCSRDIAREGKRQPQPYQNIMDNNVVEHGGASDDIPMEIVELLAKNQRERAFGNSIRGTPTVYTTNFPFSNTNMTGGNNMGLVRQRIPNFPEAKNCPFDIGSNNNNNPSSSYRPNQQTQTQQLPSNSIISGADLLWPPRRKNVPFHLNGSNKNNHYVQSNNGLDNLHAFSDHYYIGKPVSEITSRDKKVEEGRSGPRPKPVGSLDAYSNDAIPAMQLLSLMDRRVVPTTGSSDKVGSSGFLDKPFSPCNHHPRLNGNENRKDPFFSSSFFSQSSRQTKEVPSLFNGVCFSSGSSNKSYLQEKGQMAPQQSNVVMQQSRGNNNNNQGLEICSLNRNPADFSIPDVGNEYMISAKDLKPRKRKYTRKERFFPANMEAQKRPRMAKDAVAKK